jgi:hypothetical protein
MTRPDRPADGLVSVLGDPATIHGRSPPSGFWFWIAYSAMEASMSAFPGPLADIDPTPGAVFALDGPYSGLEIQQVVPLGGGAFAILFDPDTRLGPGDFKNLVGLRRTGEVVWVADLPSRDDTYVFLRSEDGTLRANSWSGYFVALDAATGAILDAKFTK